jgi:hypothetical protein
MKAESGPAKEDNRHTTGSTGSISRARMRPRGEGSFTPASLPFGAACLPEVEET